MTVGGAATKRGRGRGQAPGGRPSLGLVRRHPEFPTLAVPRHGPEVAEHLVEGIGTALGQALRRSRPRRSASSLRPQSRAGPRRKGSGRLALQIALQRRR